MPLFQYQGRAEAIGPLSGPVLVPIPRVEAPQPRRPLANVALMVAGVFAPTFTPQFVPIPRVESVQPSRAPSRLATPGYLAHTPIPIAATVAPAPSDVQYPQPSRPLRMASSTGQFAPAFTPPFVPLGSVEIIQPSRTPSRVAVAGWYAAPATVPVAALPALPLVDSPQPLRLASRVAVQGWYARADVPVILPDTEWAQPGRALQSPRVGWSAFVPLPGPPWTQQPDTHYPAIVRGMPGAVERWRLGWCPQDILAPVIVGPTQLDTTLAQHGAAGGVIVYTGVGIGVLVQRGPGNGTFGAA